MESCEAASTTCFSQIILSSLSFSCSFIRSYEWFSQSSAGHKHTLSFNSMTELHGEQRFWTGTCSDWWGRLSQWRDTTRWLIKQTTNPAVLGTLPQSAGFRHGFTGCVCSSHMKEISLWPEDKKMHNFFHFTWNMSKQKVSLGAAWVSNLIFSYWSKKIGICGWKKWAVCSAHSVFLWWPSIQLSVVMFVLTTASSLMSCSRKTEAILERNHSPQCAEADGLQRPWTHFETSKRKSLSKHKAGPQSRAHTWTLFVHTL